MLADGLTKHHNSVMCLIFIREMRIEWESMNCWVMGGCWMNNPAGDPASLFVTPAVFMAYAHACKYVSLLVSCN